MDSLAEYTKKVEIGDIYKDLGLGKSISAKKVTVYVDGVENASQPARDITKGDDKNKYGDNGVLTEVFYNDDNDSVIITEVNTYIGSINKTVKATDKKDAYVVVTAEGPVVANFKNEFETDDKFEVDDYVLYTYSLKEKEIESVAAATKVEGTVTVAENSDTNNNDKKALTIDGTRYKASAQIGGQNLSDVSVKQDYTIYVDAYGYMIYVEEVEEIGNYALILNIAGKLTLKNGTTDTTNHKNEIVTVDKDAKSFYVNTDDEISVFSYNTIAKDENDVVYAVIKDYMVKTLVIYEKDGNTDPVTPPLSDDIEVKTVDIDTPKTTIKFYVESGKATTLTTSDIKAILADKGCKDITKSGATWSFTYDGMTFAGVTVTQEQVYKVTFKVGPTAAGYTNKIVSGSSAYMSATGSKTATVVMSGSGWTGVTPTVVADPVAGGTFTIVAADTTTLTVTATAISKAVTVTIDF